MKTKQVYFLISFFMFGTVANTHASPFIVEAETEQVVTNTVNLPDELFLLGDSPEDWSRYDNYRDQTIWEEGMTGAEIVNQATVNASANTPFVQNSMSYGPQAAEQQTQNNTGIRVREDITTDVQHVGNIWHSPGANIMIIDENTHTQGHEVVGAYANMVKQENIHISAGPEVYIPEEDSSPLQNSDGPNASEVGMGMRLTFGF